MLTTVDWDRKNGPGQMGDGQPSARQAKKPRPNHWIHQTAGPVTALAMNACAPRTALRSQGRARTTRW